MAGDGTQMRRLPRYYVIFLGVIGYKCYFLRPTFLAAEMLKNVLLEVKNVLLEVKNVLQEVLFLF